MRSIVRLAFMALVVPFSVAATGQSLWSEPTASQAAELQSRSTAALPSKYKLKKLNTSTLSALQAAIPVEQPNVATIGIPFEFPLPDGGIQATSIVETSIWADKAIENSIGIKTYSLINPVTKQLEGSISIWNQEINGILYSTEGVAYINPVKNSDGTHMINYLQDGGENSLKCFVDEVAPALNSTGLQRRGTAGDSKKRTYRLAVAATGEYYAWAGSSVALAQADITNTINIIRTIYQRDLNVFFTLVDNTNIIYTDAATDPYTTAGLDGTTLNQNQNAIDGMIGSPNYDVGIVFNRGWSGGLAQLQAVCQFGGKARGACGYASGTGANPTPGPQGQWFDGAVAHELGHMFGATHSFASNNAGNCVSNRSVGSSWEPGSGSTLMAYAAAGCGVTNSIQTYQDYYFHGGSIGQMQNFILSAATCAPGVTTANVAPVVSTMGTNFNIPANTPFVLTVTATDANGDALSYSWEQVDASSSTENQTVPPQGTNVTGPLFRSRPAVSTGTRYFPALQYLTSGSPYAYEVLPSVARTMNFRGTVRDNSSLGGITSEVNVQLNVHTSTGFKVTKPAWGTVWNPSVSTTASVEWDVAGSNAAPINCATVDILFSFDGGNTYPAVLASGVANDGQHTVNVPWTPTSNGRVMVKAANNVFFSISEEAVPVLPVTFLDFSARKEGDKAVALRWSTATETNSDKFIVERSANGIDFNSQLGSVAAAGNSTTVQTYGFNDEMPLNRWNYYRLKQLDKDGKFSYSKIASVYFDKGASVTVYPNPVRTSTALEFVTERAGRINMEVYDSKGSLVIKRSINAASGYNKTEVDLSSLSTGIFTLKCYSETNTLGVLKLVKE